MIDEYRKKLLSLNEDLRRQCDIADYIAISSATALETIGVAYMLTRALGVAKGNEYLERVKERVDVLPNLGEDDDM